MSVILLVSPTGGHALSIYNTAELCCIELRQCLRHGRNCQHIQSYGQTYAHTAAGDDGVSSDDIHMDQVEETSRERARERECGKRFISGSFYSY